MYIFGNYRFDFRVVVQAVFSKLSSVAGSLVASERSLSGKHVITVHPAGGAQTFIYIHRICIYCIYKNIHIQTHTHTNVGCWQYMGGD